MALGADIVFKSGQEITPGDTNTHKLVFDSPMIGGISPFTANPRVTTAAGAGVKFGSGANSHDGTNMLTYQWGAGAVNPFAFGPDQPLYVQASNVGDKFLITVTP